MESSIKTHIHVYVSKYSAAVRFTYKKHGLCHAYNLHEIIRSFHYNDLQRKRRNVEMKYINKNETIILKINK